MMELIEANWPFLVAALLLGLLVAWWIFAATRRTRIQRDTRDVLDEGAAAAPRNQALIDSPGPHAVAPPNSRMTKPEQEEPTAVPASLVSATAKILPDAQTTPIAPGPEGVRTATGYAAAQGSDDLTRIKGVGPKLRDTLTQLGVTTFAQIAAWSDVDVARIDAQLGRFQGRIERDDWREQARLLQVGDIAAYEQKFGRI